MMTTKKTMLQGRHQNNENKQQNQLTINTQTKIRQPAENNNDHDGEMKSNKIGPQRRSTR